MRLDKLSIGVVLVVIVATVGTSNIVRDVREKQEKTRLENIVSPVVVTAVEGTPDPKPSLSFINATEKSLMVVLRWEQKSESVVRNDMRERVSTAIRRELASDPGSWGRHISVIFDDEVVTQGAK